MAYALIDYPNDKGVHAAKVMDESELGPDLSNVTAQPSNVENGIIFVDANGEEQEGTKPIRTTDVEISDLSPVHIPEGSYDGTVSAKLSSAAVASVDPAIIKKDAVILGQVGTYEGADTLGQYFDNTLTSVENDTITSLPASFFDGKTALQSAKFPALTATPSFCFRRCSGLVDVDVSGVRSIGNDSFRQCIGLTTINIPFATQLGVASFSGCSNLQAVNGDAITQLGNNVFDSCNNLTTISVSSVTSLGHSAFSECHSIPQTMVFDLVTSMAAGNPGTFYNASVKHLEFPAFLSSMNYITSGTPFRYSNVESIIFNKITNIGQNFFRDAPKLTDLVIRTDSVCTLVNINAFDNSPFSSTGTGGTLYIKKSLYDHLGDGTADDYLNATNWSVILAYTNNQILPIEGSQYEVTT